MRLPFIAFSPPRETQRSEEKKKERKRKEPGLYTSSPIPSLLPTSVRNTVPHIGTRTESNDVADVHRHRHRHRHDNAHSSCTEIPSSNR